MPDDDQRRRERAQRGASRVERRAARAHRRSADSVPPSEPGPAGRSATPARLARRHRVGAAPMTHRRAHTAARALRALSTVLIVSGTLLLADAGGDAAVAGAAVRALRAARSRTSSRTSSTTLERVRPTPVEQRRSRSCPTPPAARVPRPLARPPDRGRRRRSAGIRITAIGVSTVFVEGTDAGDLRAGPGHYPGHAAARPARHVGDRRAPHDLRRAVPQGRQAARAATRS